MSLKRIINHPRVIRLLRRFVADSGRPTRFSLWLLGIFMGYLLLVGLILPHVLRGVLEKQLSAALNTQASVAALRCNPLTLTLTALGVTIPYPEKAVPESSGPFLSLDALEITPSLRSYLRLAPGIKSLRIINPVLDVTLAKDGLLSPHTFFPDGKEAEAQQQTQPGPIFPFLVYDMELIGGQLTFRDQVHKTTQIINDINLRVPFASTLTADRDRAVMPTLNATINGRHLLFSGEALPFADPLRTEFTLQAGNMELEQFRAYLAPYTPLTLRNGTVFSVVTLGLERAPDKPMNISLSGKLTLDNLDMAVPGGAKVLGLGRGYLEVESALLGPRRIIVKEFTLAKPYLAVSRKADGNLDWTGFITLPKAGEVPRSTPVLPAAPASVNATNATSNAANGTVPRLQARERSETPPHITVSSASITEGTLVWRDAAVPGGFSREVSDIRLNVSDLDTAGAGTVHFEASAGTAKNGGFIGASGRAALSPLSVNATTKAEKISLPLFAPYVAANLPLNLDGGALDIEGALTILPAQKAGLQAGFSKGEVAVTELALSQGKGKLPLAKINRFSLGDIALDTAARSVTLGKVLFTGAALELTRQKDGSLLLPLPETAGAKDQAPPAVSQKKPASQSRKGRAPSRTADRPQPTAKVAVQNSDLDWRFGLGSLRVSSSSVSFMDQSLKKRSQLALSGINLELTDFSTEQGKPLALDVNLKPGRNGSVALKTKGTLTPLRMQYQATLTKADVTFLAPYLGEFSTLTLAGGSLTGVLQGAVAKARPEASLDLTVQGGLSLDNLALNEGRSEFASLGRLALHALRYTSTPKGSGTLALERISVERPKLSLGLQADGTSTLHRIFPRQEAKGALKPAAEQQLTKAVDQDPPKPEVIGGFESVSIGEFILADGNVTFRDQSFARPYILVLSALSASMKDMRSDPESRAALEVTAKVGGSPLSITGEGNVLVQPPALSSAVSLKGFSLSAVSAYAEKFIDYPITKGQLTANIDISLADGAIDARNSLVFSQLVLGDKLNTPGAPNWPVKAAISLLSDFNGDVSLNIPISGKMDDPQFRTGGIVGKVFANIMLKTVASPFSLVTGLIGGTINLLSGGGGPDLDVIAFRPGSERLNAQAQKNLEGLAAALKKRPALKVELVGFADAAERSDVVDAMVRRRMQQLKYDNLPRGERAATTPEQQRVSLQADAEEYGRLLAKVYADMPFARGLNGRVQEEPPQEMLRLIHANTTISDGKLEDLAEARAKAVRDALLAGDADLAKRVTLGKAVVTPEGKSEGKATAYVKLLMQ